MTIYEDGDNANEEKEQEPTGKDKNGRNTGEVIVIEGGKGYSRKNAIIIKGGRTFHQAEAIAYRYADEVCEEKGPDWYTHAHKYEYGVFRETMYI